jgi:hypothetical protein
MLIRGLIRDLDEGVAECLVRSRAKGKGLDFDQLIYYAIPFLKRFD